MTAIEDRLLRPMDELILQLTALSAKVATPEDKATVEWCVKRCWEEQQKMKAFIEETAAAATVIRYAADAAPQEAAQ